MGKWKKESLDVVFLIATIIIILLFGYGIGRIYGISIYPDEFGYWASAASLLGWDWSEVASLGSYYSFGYSAILYPILALTSDSVVAYRIAVGVNYILIIIALFLMRQLGKYLFEKIDRQARDVVVGITVLYPAWLLYAQMTLTEAMLMFMVILLVYLWFRFLKEPGLLWGLLLILAGVYTYSLHLRTVGVLLACGLTLVGWALCNPAARKKVLFFLVLGTVVTILLFLGKDVIQQSVYTQADAQTLQVNDYGGQIDKIRLLLTWHGIRNFTVNMAGKFLYMGFATGGLAFWGLYWCVVKIWALIREICKKQIQSVSGWLAVFIFLIVLGELAVCGIYTIGILEPDWIIYGRYIEAIIPVLILFGGYGIYECEKKTRVQCGILVLYGVMAGICVLACINVGESHIRGVHSVMTSILIGDGNVTPKIFFGTIWLVGSLASIAVMTLLQFLSKDGSRRKLWIAGVLFAVQVLIIVRISHMHVYSYNQSTRMDLAVVDILSNQKYEEKELIFLREGEEAWIGFLQMQFRDRKIRLIREDEINQLSEQEVADSVMLTYYNSEYLEELERLYSHKILADVYYMFYQ